MIYNLKGLYIEVTSKCNLRCKHCYNNSGDTNDEISFDCLESLIADASREGVTNFTISGGEPFIRKDIVEIIELCLHNPITTITIVTNATLVTEKTLLNIKNRIDNTDRIMFQISVDGPDSESHNYLRGNGAFEKLSNKLELFQTFGLKISFHVVLHSHNFHKVNRILEYAKQHNVTKVDFTFLKKKGRTDLWYDELLISPEKELELVNKLKTLPQQEDSVPFSFPQVFYGECPLFAENNSSETDIFVRIDPCGNLFPCQNFDTLDSSIGNINNSLLRDIITDINMQQLYRKILKKRAEKGLCKTCFVNQFCGKGCLGVEFCDDYCEKHSNECLLRRKLFLTELQGLGTRLLKE